MDLTKAMMISAAGMKAQGTRMRVISENLANASSVASAPGVDPYRRKVVTFSNTLDREMGVTRVNVKGVTYDQSDFGMRYEPGHPGADENGYVKTPNVNGLVEAMDMKQSQRSYEANLNSIEVSKKMVMRTIDLLR
ncbi:flagellar basal body rod protein FlgC [Paremcibacter congregatus]|uniref:Flagellar basal-body rod protein FlgC n=1 Tax=Paremcibacter congregatus TaxID=2043170 RepID=A0A2G4YM17_9PROT|nr:flagellar basal body rod protein FlgC [Paremcibacter congregatus]PHZ83363.1 flagellar basal body rod protein FlgC [Paremcibacter congregatus]QDE28166.1 flagellar basal body rod protein FlgC [Paremcibacter congregatus]|tara:strand:- start:5515 stop:5922 length:408 start_codon:yes stop_codon:yes gene_type:complete